MWLKKRRQPRKDFSILFFAPISAAAPYFHYQFSCCCCCWVWNFLLDLYRQHTQRYGRTDGWPILIRCVCPVSHSLVVACVLYSNLRLVYYIAWILSITFADQCELSSILRSCRLVYRQHHQLFIDFGHVQQPPAAAIQSRISPGLDHILY